MNDRERQVASAIRRHRGKIVALLAQLGVIAGVPLACSTGGSPRSGSGLLVAPMQSAPADSNASAGDAGPDGATLFRPLPTEPRKPRGDCERSVDCVAEQAETPAWPFAPPFTKCAVSGDNGGTFHERETRTARRETADACCYVSFECEGSSARPTHRPSTVQVIRGRRLEGGPPIDGAGLSAMLQAEHQSVVAFRALARDLALHGAPAELVASAFDAAEEEASHAVATLRLAELGNESITYDDREAPMPAPATFAAIVRSSFLDGCVGEGAAALSFDVAAKATDPETGGILAAIAEDERRHAELGWRTLVWALKHDPLVAHAELTSAMAELRLLGVPFDSMFLDVATAQALADDFARDVLLPLGERLLATAPPPSPRGDDFARAA